MAEMFQRDQYERSIGNLGKPLIRSKLGEPPKVPPGPLGQHMAMFIPTPVLVKDISEKLPTRTREGTLRRNNIGIG